MTIFNDLASVWQLRREAGLAISFACRLTFLCCAGSSSLTQIFYPLLLLCYTFGWCGTTPPGSVIGLVTGAL